MTVRQSILAILLVLFANIGGQAQEFIWNIDFNTVFDNREGDDKYFEDKTFFFTRLAPEVGLSMQNGKHNILGGLSWSQPIGNGWKDYRIEPTLYYSFVSPKVRMNFGMFPKHRLVRSLPGYIWCDSVQYRQSNIRGLEVAYLRNEGFFEAIVDWRSMQTETQREAFNLIGRGEWMPKRKWFLAGGLIMMNHFAKQKNAPEDQKIVDNFITHLYVGADVARYTPLDSLAIRVGWLADITRNRADSKWRTPSGLQCDIAARWRWLGVNNSLYVGQGMFPYYSQFGALLNQGEAYYQSPWYDRLQVYGYIFRNSFLNLEASLDFNFAKNNFNFYQRLLLRVYVDSNLWKHRKHLPKGVYINNIY